MNFRFWKPKWGIFSKFLASVLVLSLTLLISPGCSALKRVEGEVEDNTEEVKLIPQSSEHIFIGVIPWVGWTPFIVAEEKGFFKDEGLDVKVVVFPDPQSRHNAFMAGNIQFCGGSTGDYVLQAANGYPITIIMETDCDNTGIIITKYEFNDLSGLRGRTVACKIESMDYFFLERALEMYRLTTDDVTVMDTTPREGIIAFMKGNVDAVVSWWQPLAHEAVKGGKGKVFMTSGDIPEILTDCVCVQNKFLKENPEAIIKVLKCWFRGVKWSKERQNEYYEIANERLFYINPQAKEDLKHQQFLVEVFKPEEIKERMKEEGPLYQYCQEILDFYYDKGMIHSRPDPTSFINNDLYLETLEAYYG